ncbi:MAG: ThiF family adenylyltransferase [Promethearchaeota archaeon]
MTKELSSEEKEITKRQKLIKGWDQIAIKNSTIFIAGVGALGCEIAKDFALCGIGKLILCDLDTIETSNLSRQMLFYKGDEGRPKAEVAAERLKKMNPYMEIEYYFKKIQELPMDLYKSCDVIIAALDNVRARIDLNKICLNLKKPLLEGGTVGMEGHIQVIIPEGTCNNFGDPIEYGNKETIIDGLVEEKLWSLDENQYPDYFSAQQEIDILEETVEQIRSERIQPVIDNIRKEVAKEVDEQPEKFFNFTPCYRCAVPVPPAAGRLAAACTLKGIPRNRIHCALKSEVIYYNKYDKKPDYTNPNDVEILMKIANTELKSLWKRVLEENISHEEKNTISKEEVIERGKNIELTYGPVFSAEDMENIIGNKIPAVQTVSSIISSLESQEALKLLFLMQGVKVGEIMNPAYINYNGVYGQFDMIPMKRRQDCVACGEVEGIENLNIIIPKDATFEYLFNLIEKQGFKLNPEVWSITNSMTKKFIYLPGNLNSPGLKDQVTENEITSGNFYKFSAAPSNAVNGIYTLNVLIDFLEQ